MEKQKSDINEVVRLLVGYVNSKEVHVDLPPCRAVGVADGIGRDDRPVCRFSLAQAVGS